MHEFGIASEIWEAVQRAVLCTFEQQNGSSSSREQVICSARAAPKTGSNERENGAELLAPARVTAITVELGELNLIEDEQLRFWVAALAERDGSSGVDLRITHMPVRVRCRACGEESAVELSGRQPGFFLPPELSCALCGSRMVNAVGGREIRVVSAEVDQEGNDGSGG